MPPRKAEPDPRVAANPFLARQLAVGCRRYAQLLVETAQEKVSTEYATSDLNSPVVGAYTLDSAKELADVFRQHADDLLSAHHNGTGLE